MRSQLLSTTFEPYAGNPVLRPGDGAWRSANVYNPAAVVHNGQVVLLYRAHAADKVSRLGLAFSDDGVSFTWESEPVLEPTEPYESRGCEDPRLTLVDGSYYLTYTGFDGFSAQLCLATSSDLRTWAKHGPVFPNLDTWRTVPWMVARREPRPWSKAGGILPVPVGGKWHMYVGEGAVYHATSSDLLSWTLSEEPVLQPRPGLWDQDLVEVGPPPVVEANHVVLVVNGARVTSLDQLDVDYRCGRVAFALDDPGHVLARDAEPFLAPSAPEDRAGLVPNVTFAEGLVHHGGRWLLYYGQSDTTTGVATEAPPRSPATT